MEKAFASKPQITSYNPERRSARISWVITTLAFVGIFAPHIAGMDGFNGGFAISFGCIIIFITGLITSIFFMKRARRLERILKGELLAHWTYTRDEWQLYTERDFAEDKLVKKKTFLMVAVMAIIVGVILIAIEHDEPQIIALIILGIIAVAGISALVSTRHTYRQNKKFHGEAHIAPDGVYLNRQFHSWKGLGAKLESVSYDSKYQKQSILTFDYSAPGRYNRYYYTVHVPVPHGEEEQAKSLAAIFNQTK